MSRTFTRSCGNSLSKAQLGFAVPRSRPRYTCPESTLISRTGNCFATSIANAVLPTAVGPVITTTRRVDSTGVTNCQTPLVEYCVGPTPVFSGPGGTIGQFLSFRSVSRWGGHGYTNPNGRFSPSVGANCSFQVMSVVDSP